MKNTYRILFSLIVFLSGLALLPAMKLPAEGFSWQRFAGAYVPSMLEVSHPSGQPGSFFTITGISYPANATLTVFVNGVSLGDVQTDSNGNLLFVIDTTGAALGSYTVVVDQVNDVFVRFQLKSGDSLWPKEVTAPVLQLPPDIANHLMFLPAIHQ